MNLMSDVIQAVLSWGPEIYQGIGGAFLVGGGIALTGDEKDRKNGGIMVFLAGCCFLLIRLMQ